MIYGNPRDLVVYDNPRVRWFMVTPGAIAFMVAVEPRGWKVYGNPSG